MPKMKFDPSEMKSALASSRIVKPTTKDIVLRIRDQCLEMISQDVRSRSISRVKSLDSNFPESYSSEEYYLSADRHQILESNLSSVSITETDKGLSIKYEDDGNVRQAQIRKRAENARRSRLPEFSFPEEFYKLDSKKFAKLLHLVSCSALVKETKSDQDMKINQVHFFKEKSCAYSHARTYASSAFMDSIPFDLSIVSSDIPQIINFLSKIHGEFHISFDNSKLYLFNADRTRFLTCSQVKTNRPVFDLYSENGYSVVFSADLSQITENLNWAVTSIEGTNKVGLKSIQEGSNFFVDLYGPTGQVSRFPIQFIEGNEISIDIQIGKFQHIINHIDSERVYMRFGHPKLPNTIEIYNDDSSDVKVRHFLKYIGGSQ